MAVNAIYDSAQLRTSWSHISCILISDTVLKSKVLTKLDTIGRYQEIRMTPWVYGTNESIEQLFNVPAFFNLSPLNTLAHEPSEEHKQRSYIVPIRYFDFMALITEPASTVLLPNLSIDKGTWSLNQKENPKLVINGVFAISEVVSKGFFPNDKLAGLRWMETDTKRSPVTITNKNGEYAGLVVLSKPKIRKKLNIVNGMPQFRVNVKLHGNVVEALDDMNKTEMEMKAAARVREEIISTFKNGIASKQICTAWSTYCLRKTPDFGKNPSDVCQTDGCRFFGIGTCRSPSGSCRYEAAPHHDGPAAPSTRKEAGS